MTETITATPPTASPELFAHVATRDAAIAHFRGRLGFEADVSDVAAALAVTEPGAEPGFVLVDTRSDASWAQGHVPGAVHLPGRRIAADAAELIPAGAPVVVYCWGPGCNGSTRAALEFALLGHPVKEMLGGFEYWVREGFAYDTADGRAQLGADPLTNVAEAGLGGGAVVDGAISCAC
ncbi:rhodanese-like domain-containing protein [Agromyces cerinus]|uniref:Rhodanese-related sulfurtransferase n=1 Tax=Agromyces cerinus subsp. cerinus TaxID=232089 RepID=A0A1N6HUB5_9MICO|nr:rhodanese-like domain-containing protein [Agromyces cerinus]SIO23382.1 Rhodanese-related sulfurtransferase [Agromyces cerinus subsp. cerinus]